MTAVWIAGGAAVWLLVATPLALLIGGMIRQADEYEAQR